MIPYAWVCSQIARQAIDGPRSYGEAQLFALRMYVRHPELDPDGRRRAEHATAARRAYATAARVVRGHAAFVAAMAGDHARSLVLLDGRTAP